MGKGVPRLLLLDEILQRLLLKSGVSAGRAHCRVCAFARVLLVQSQYVSMTADSQRVLEDVRVALGLWYVVRASQRLGCWRGGLASVTFLGKKKSLMVHLKHPTAVIDLSFLICSLHVRVRC